MSNDRHHTYSKSTSAHNNSLHVIKTIRRKPIIGRTANVFATKETKYFLPKELLLCNEVPMLFNVEQTPKPYIDHNSALKVHKINAISSCKEHNFTSVASILSKTIEINQKKSIGMSSSAVAMSNKGRNKKVTSEEHSNRKMQPILPYFNSLLSNILASAKSKYRLHSVLAADAKPEYSGNNHLYTIRTGSITKYKARNVATAEATTHKESKKLPLNYALDKSANDGKEEDKFLPTSCKNSVLSPHNYKNPIASSSIICTHLSQRKLPSRKRNEMTHSSAVKQRKVHQKNHTEFDIPKILLNIDVYSYLIAYGNNSTLVQRVIMSRPDWYQCTSRKSTVQLTWVPCSKSINYNSIKAQNKVQLINHFECHYELTTKHRLFQNLSSYFELIKRNVFDYVPLTFVLDKSQLQYNDDLDKVTQCFNMLSSASQFIVDLTSREKLLRVLNNKLSEFTVAQRQGSIRSCKPMMSLSQFTGKNLWIFKPSNLNRGRGVVVFSTLNQLLNIINECETNKDASDRKITRAARFGHSKDRECFQNVYVVQKYIEEPLLVYKRKFDIRVWLLITHEIKAYFYKEGYLRLSSYEYSTDVNSKEVHLTNNAIQKFTQSYGQAEDGNQMSFNQFQQYLDANNINYSTRKTLYPQMKAYANAVVQSIRKKLNPNEIKYCFEIYGLDFMIDCNLGLWLIEVNTNPCLEESSNLLKQLIPRMLSDAFKLTVDVIFPQKKPIKCKFSVAEYPDDECLWDHIDSGDYR